MSLEDEELMMESSIIEIFNLRLANTRATYTGGLVSKNLECLAKELRSAFNRYEYAKVRLAVFIELPRNRMESVC